MNNSYKDSGVDVEAGYKAVELMKKSVESTYTKGVIGGIGGFGGMFEPDLTDMTRPCFVSGTDGVGTKLKLAFMADKHDTVGIDCVAMCANDVACAGAKPLFFLDYIACGKNEPSRIASIVSGVAEGCRQAGAALIGGETAEMPGFYPENEYDLAGFCVGMVDFDKKIDGSTIRQGDVLIGIPSSGAHSNGFSLIRKLFPNPSDELLLQLLTPTKIYVKDIAALQQIAVIKGLAHITGGGWIENIPRMLPAGLHAVMTKPVSPAPELFCRIQREGGIPEQDMYNTFNMGVGLVACVSRADAEKTAYPVIGEVAEGSVTHGIKLW